MMYCTQEDYGGELLTQNFMIFLEYLNFSFSIPPVVYIASS